MKRIALFSLLLLTATQSVAKATADTSAGTTTATVDTAKANLKTRATLAFRSLTSSNKRMAGLAIVAGGCGWAAYEELTNDGVVSALENGKYKAQEAWDTFKEKFNELTSSK
jgi:hypothetical protein